MAGRDEAAPAGRGAPPVALAAIFALSGLGVLVVESVWIRWLRLSLGATAPAVSITLVAFLLGQTIGAAIGARAAPRARRPLVLYAGFELAGALAAALVPLVLVGLRGLLDPSYDALRIRPGALVTARLAVALVATLPAAICFGATFPAITQVVARRARSVATRGVLLYGANTLGAAAGAALAAFWLPDALGVRAAYGVGLGALALASAAAFALRARAANTESSGVREARERRPAAHAPMRVRPSPALLGISALSGFGTFGAQLLAMQAFALVLDQSTHAVGSVLVVVLLALGAGALIVGALERRGAGSSDGRLGVALAAAAIALLWFPAGFVRTTGLAYLGATSAWPGYLLRALGLAALTAGPALLCTALVFPLALAAAGRTTAGAGGAVAGRMLAANTLGALLGAISAPWVLLPALGPWAAFAAIAAAYAAAAVLVAPGGASVRGLRAAALILAAGSAWLAGLAPTQLPLLIPRADERVIAVDSTPSGLVAVVERRGARRIQIDNHYALGGEADRVHQERQGHLPLVLHTAPRRVAFLGAATGSSASAAPAHGVERIAMVELVSEVADAARRHLHRAGGSIYERPGSEVVLDDARNFLRATDEHFDVIVADLFVPWRSGAGALFTLEHFRAARDHLAPGGLFCQWLPLYQLSEEEFAIVAATFLDVFPDAQLFRGDFYGRFPIAALIGPRDALATADAVGRAALALGEQGVDDRWVTSPAGVFALYVGPLGEALPMLRDAPRNTDDWPVIEFRAARTHAGAAGKLDPFVGLSWTAFGEQLQSAVARHAGRPDAAPGFVLPPALDSARRGGSALQRAGALYVAGREREAGKALAAAAKWLPDALVAGARPDPTAAELWWDVAE